MVGQKIGRVNQNQNQKSRKRCRSSRVEELGNANIKSTTRMMTRTTRTRNVTIVGILLALLITNTIVLQVEAKRRPTVKATVRSFLPSVCMKNKTLFYDIWEYELRNRPSYDKIEDQDAESCAYYDEILAGKIGGHPDFESENINNGLTAKDRSIVQSEARLSHSGLNKPVYCSETERCGYVETVRVKPDDGGPRYEVDVFSTSGKQYFDAWYNDDPFYNKRIGFEWELVTGRCYNSTVINSTEIIEVCEQTFDSGDDDEFGNGEADDFFGPLDQFLDSVTEQTYQDFDLAPAWPYKEKLEKRNRAIHKFWFTSEIHTHFKYRGDEIFNFAGDDDVFVFINGQLVIDLGGVHQVEKAKVSLANKGEELGLVPGNVYTFDMFHAERHTFDSNFKLETTLVDACNVLESGSFSFVYPAWTDEQVEEAKNGQESSYDGEDLAYEPIPTSDLVFGRGAYEDKETNEIILTSPSTVTTSTFVYAAAQQNVGTGFIADYDFKVSEDGDAEGFTFILHQRENGLDNMPLSVGSGLGTRFITNSIAVAFDLCVANPDNDNPNACDKEQVRIHFPDDPSLSNSVESDTLKVWDNLFAFRRGETYTVSVRYLEEPDVLEVYINNSLYLRQSSFNIEKILGGGRNAYAGFTSGTYSNPATISISSWNISTVSLDPTKTAFTAGSLSEDKDNSVVADGTSGTGFDLETFDACENKVYHGGFPHFMKGVFVEVLQNGRYAQGRTEPNIIPADIVDNNDGSYSGLLRTTDLGSYVFYACFGASCDLVVTIEPRDNDQRVLRRQLNDAPLVAVVTMNSTSSADSRFFHVDDPITSIEVERLPTQPPTGPASNPRVIENDTMLYVGISGGVFVVLLTCFFCILFPLRKKWAKDKAYIEKGRNHRMQAHIKYDETEDELSRVGRMLLNTRASIMRHTARKYKEPRDAEIAGLREQQQELQEHIRLQKKRQQQKREKDAAQVELTSFQPSLPSDNFRKKKKQFRGGDSFEYHSDSD